MPNVALARIAIALLVALATSPIVLADVYARSDTAEESFVTAAGSLPVCKCCIGDKDDPVGVCAECTGPECTCGFNELGLPECTNSLDAKEGGT